MGNYTLNPSMTQPIYDPTRPFTTPNGSWTGGVGAAIPGHWRSFQLKFLLIKQSTQFDVGTIQFDVRTISTIELFVFTSSIKIPFLLELGF